MLCSLFVAEGDVYNNAFFPGHAAFIALAVVVHYFWLAVTARWLLWFLVAITMSLRAAAIIVSMDICCYLDINNGILCEFNCVIESFFPRLMCLYFILVNAWSILRCSWYGCVLWQFLVRKRQLRPCLLVILVPVIFLLTLTSLMYTAKVQVYHQMYLGMRPALATRGWFVRSSVSSVLSGGSAALFASQ